MTGRVGASVEVLQWHLAAHRAAGCPSEASVDTKCRHCNAVMVLSCSTCRLPLYIVATSPCSVTADPGIVPYIPPTGAVA